jgi:cytochrome b subunit of formate dehydrogenase
MFKPYCFCSRTSFSHLNDYLNFHFVLSIVKISVTKLHLHIAYFQGKEMYERELIRLQLISPFLTLSSPHYVSWLHIYLTMYFFSFRWPNKRYNTSGKIFWNTKQSKKNLNQLCKLYSDSVFLFMCISSSFDI